MNQDSQINTHSRRPIERGQDPHLQNGHAQNEHMSSEHERRVENGHRTSQTPHSVGPGVVERVGKIERVKTMMMTMLL